MKETEQMQFWKSDFGDDYTERNSGEWDAYYKKTWGVTRSALNKEFLAGIPLSAMILEVGCNRGHQLDILQKQGFTKLSGIEINAQAIALARQNVQFQIMEGSALDIPFKDNYFDVVFTSGVLIHIAPADLPQTIDEIYRVSKKFIWCFEYYADACETIEYRGHKNRLWKNNFLNLFLERHPTLSIVRQKKLHYLKNPNVDMMFLLQKNT